MSCVGIELCGKKNCLEQERCCQWPTHIEFIPRGSKGSRKKRNHNKEPAKPLCEIHIKFCTNKRACEILGQCILKHPLVVQDKMASNQLRQPVSIDTIVKIVERLKPTTLQIKRRIYGYKKNTGSNGKKK